MGRPGRGGGGGSRGGSSRSGRGGSSRSHSSSRSSFSRPSRPSRPSGGGFGGPRPSHGPRPRPMGPGPRPPRPPRRTYYRSGGSSGGGCSATLFALIFLFIIGMYIVTSMINGGTNFSSNKQYDTNVIDENIVYEQAQKFYSDNFNDENHALLYYAYLEETESDMAQLVIGDDAITIFDDDMQDEFWEIYDKYYYGDVEEEEWLAYTFEDVAKVIADRRGAIDNSKSFYKSCYNDKLNWIGSSGKNTLIAGLEAFYDMTGIQPYIVLIEYESLPGVVVSTGNNSTVLKTLIVAVAVIIVVVLLINWWKRVQARKKEEAETTERMLNTPLEKFGETDDKDLNDLIDKYDN